MSSGTYEYVKYLRNGKSRIVTAVKRSKKPAKQENK